ALLALRPEAVNSSPPDECAAASAHLTLKAEPSARVPVVCISPDVPLTFRFDMPLQPESVRLEERERFEDMAPGQRSLTLVPPKELEAGERFQVEVCFADGAAPACARFPLRAHPALGLSQVKVSREHRPVEACQEAEQAAQAAVRECREEVRQLRAERGGPEGLRGALASGLLKKQGIAFKDLSKDVTQPKGNVLVLVGVHAYRAKGGVAVDVWLDNPSTTEPWTAAGAVLRGPKGQVLKPLPLWQPGPVPPSEPGARGTGRVVVEVLASEVEARGTYTLTLWDEEQKRTVTLGPITFP
ncbi:DUF2381 family protein, partial [Archangium sp.]|uniref:DUF2381 family protein n=1 Tax=Archangium sp. TaxID=1872627 RepID=UPI00286CFA25